MFFPNIFGGYDSRDLPNIQPGTDIPEADIMAAIQEWRDYYNSVVTLFEDMLATREQQPSGNFGSGGGGGELQPYVEYGETEATRAPEAQWGWAAPIRRYRDRQLYTEEYLASNNLDTINKDVIYATVRDFTTRIKMMLRAILGNANFTWNDPPFPGENAGPLTIYRLFNNDGSVATLNVNGTIVPMGTEQSYIPSGSGTLGLTNFALGRSKLLARGYIGRVFHIISPLDADAVKAMAGFIPLPQPVQYARTTPAPASTTAIVTRPESIGSFADGVHDGEVIAFPFWPQAYTFSFDNTKEPPVVIREHKNAKFRGFNLVQDQTRTAYGEMSIRNKRWEDIRGAAIKNRANGVVVQSTAGGYTVPTI
jgi:hypothetical protein